MGKITGSPKLVKTVATMQVGEKGSINIEDIVVSTTGELCINLEAPLISLPQELFTDFDYNDDKEDEEEEECPTVGDEYLRESFPIKRISKEKNGYEVNIDGKYIKPVCKTAFATAKSWGNFASLGTISNFQELLQKNLNPSHKQPTRTLETFSRLTPSEKRKLQKKNLESLLSQANEEENFEISDEIRNLIKETNI